MNTEFEDKYLDVLQNIEFALVRVYREYESMTDWEALQAVNGAIRTHTAEQRRKAAPSLNLSPLAQTAYDGVIAMCEWRLGRQTLSKEDGRSLDFTPITLTVDGIIACLKRIRKSIELWRKEYGRRGYFDYVSQFLT